MAKRTNPTAARVAALIKAREIQLLMAIKVGIDVTAARAAHLPIDDQRLRVLPCGCEDRS
jgi:hypothetical protein